MLQATPGQMVFGHDMILNTPLINDWEDFRRIKQQLIDKNNQLINKNRKLHTYIVRENVILRNKKSNKYEEPYKFPYPIIKL